MRAQSPPTRHHAPPTHTTYTPHTQTEKQVTGLALCRGGQTRRAAHAGIQVSHLSERELGRDSLSLLALGPQQPRRTRGRIPFC